MFVEVPTLAEKSSDRPPSPLVPACQLSVVVPVYNEESVIGLFHARLSAVLATCAGVHEIIYKIGTPQKESILAAGIALQKAGVIKPEIDVKAAVESLLDSSYH